MRDTLRVLRTSCVAAVACSALFGTLSSGCGDKKQTEAPTASTTAPGGAAPGSGAGPVQGKVSTGADPDKAPAYPNMYGKPAGSK